MRKNIVQKKCQFRPEYLIYIICGMSILFVGSKLFLVKTSAIEGELSYPSEAMPRQKICAVEITSKKETCTNENILDDEYKIPTSYRLVLKPGEYYMYASISELENKEGWGDMPGYMAFYTEYVKFGCTSGVSNNSICENRDYDFKPLVVNISEGETIKNIGFDWYHGGFSYDEIFDKKAIITITPIITMTPTLKPTNKLILTPTVVASPTTNLEAQMVIKQIDDFISKSNLRINELNKYINAYQDTINTLIKSNQDAENNYVPVIPDFAPSGYIEDPMIKENYISNLYTDSNNYISQLQVKISQAKSEINTLQSQISTLNSQKMILINNYLND